MSLIADFGRALAQLLDPRFLRVLLKALAITVVGLAAVFWAVMLGLGWILPDSVSLPWIGPVGFLDDLASWAAVGVMLVLSVVLMAPVAAAVVGFFLEDVADAVEAEHYPGLAPLEGLAVSVQAVDALRFFGLVVAVNLAALLVYVLMPPLAPVVFWLVNGFLLGREYFQLVAMRRLGPAGAKSAQGGERRADLAGGDHDGGAAERAGAEPSGADPRGGGVHAPVPPARAADLTVTRRRGLGWRRTGVGCAPGRRGTGMRMLQVLALAAAAAAAAAAAGARAPSVDAVIVLAVDASASVDGVELAVQRGGYARALRHGDFLRAVRTGAEGRIALAYFEWAGQVHRDAVLPWSIIDGPEAAAAFAAAIEALPVRASLGTSISRALEFGRSLIETAPVTADRRVIDVSGDGPNDLGPPVTEARDLAVAAGIVINGLPVLIAPSASFRAVDLYYTDCVIGGFGAFMMAARSGEELAPAIRRKLILEVSDRAPQARILPVAGGDTVDCLIGERIRRENIDRIFPGLVE